MNFRILLAIVVLTQLVGCASIVSGSNQSISIETKSQVGSVPGASCKLTNNKGTWYVTTPGSTTIQRSFQDLGVTCTKAQYMESTVAVKSTTKAMAFGNILFGGVIGVGVDVATGAAYDYPAVVSIPITVAAANQTLANPAGDKLLSAPLTTVQHESARKTTGIDTYNAERLAKSQACATPSASLVEKGAGFEAYNVSCNGGNALAIRCEFGACRILQ